jgi:hypothetical protein
LKRQEWNEEQLEQLFQQLPPIKDKQTAEDIYQSIQQKQQVMKKSRKWITPAIAAVAALILFVIISQYLLSDFTTTEESAMDLASSSENSSQLKNESVNENKMAESKKAQESTIEQHTLENKMFNRDEQETFVTSSNKAEVTITVGFTDSQAQNILPISLEVNEKQEILEQIEDVNPDLYSEELGPITFELSNTDFVDTGNPEEIVIDYKGIPKLQSSANDILYQNAIIETLRWLDYKKAKLYTNNHEGIEFGQTGSKKDLEVKKESKKAYFLYQFDEQTHKLLVPSPNSYNSIDSAINAMKRGIEERNLKPTVMKNNSPIRIKESEEQLIIEFDNRTGFEDSEPTIIMLESILLTAKEFGYKTVKFNGMNIDKIGVMDVTKPIEVPFSPNPIYTN